jgi:predicted DNA-binding transcriptional regulator AlpA
MRRREPILTTAVPEAAPRLAQGLTTSFAPERLGLRLAELAKSLGVSRRTLERERSAGRFPPPDISIGKAPLWKPETIRRWIDTGGRA